MTSPRTLVPRALVLLLTLATLWSATVVTAPSSQAAPSAAPGLDTLNQLRSLSGLPAVAADPALAGGAAEHARYMVENGVIAHSQDPTNPMFTDAGDRAARESNLTVSSSAELTPAGAVETLMVAPFHGVGFLDPRLNRTGAAMHHDPTATRFRSGYVMNVLGGRTATAPAGTRYPIVWPGDGSTVALDRYRGGEVPDPLTACPGFQAPTGLPLLVLLGGSEPLRSASVRVSGGVALETCAFDSGTYRNPDAGTQSSGRQVLASRHAVVVIPRAPLTAGQYTAEVVTSARTVRWSFRVEPGGISAPPATVAGRAITDACPDGKVPEDGFTDVAATSAHEPAIDCVVWWEIAGGVSATSFAPDRPVTRGQMATFLAQLVDRSGGTLPPVTLDRFPDDGGSPHEANINRLVTAGIVSGRSDGTFGVGEPVTRAQLATFLSRTWRYRTGADLPSSRDWFVDDAGSPHEANINAAATAGIASGVAPAKYGPSQHVSRASMATFVVRTLDVLVEESHTSTP